MDASLRQPTLVRRAIAARDNPSSNHSTRPLVTSGTFTSATQALQAIICQLANNKQLFCDTSKSTSATRNLFALAPLVVVVAAAAALLVVGPCVVEGTPIGSASSRQAAANSRRPHAKLSNNATTMTSAKLVRETDALNYLARYGYMNQSLTAAGGSLIAEEAFHEAVTSFQRFAGIPETGEVDATTVEFMQMPRCGNSDKSLSGARGETGKRRKKRKKRRRKKRYALQGSKWRRQELTYRISQYPTKFAHKKHEIDAQIEKAFRLWSDVAPIDFVHKRDGKVHIDIRFTSGEHGDGDPFDGPGNTLAHAYFPQYGGDAHFDDQEYWTIDSYTGTNILQVAAHELGHSLGLGHSSIREALMAPFYQKYKPNFKLHADDILGIQALYGEGSGSSQQPPSTSTSTTTVAAAPDSPSDNGAGSSVGNAGGHKPVDLCQDPRIDAVTRTEDGSTYVFRGNYYWQVTSDGLAANYPQKISRGWDGLPGNLDAALTWSDGKTFFFKDDKYWRFYNKRREPGYPKLISAGFAGIPNKVDAAFVWSGNGKTYFFKGDKYWRFDSKQEPPVGSQYPKSVSNWEGVPRAGVDAAFKWENGMTYFFAGDQYYRFDDREFAVDASARPAFPRSMAEWWFGCTNLNLPLRRESDDLESAAATTTHTTSYALSATAPSLVRRRLEALVDDGDDKPAAPNNSSNDHAKSAADDWSFHRGLSKKSSVEVAPDSKAAADETNGQQASRSSWLLPLLLR